MPIETASVFPIPLSAAADTVAASLTRGPRAAGVAGEFQTTLAEFSGQVPQTAQAAAVGEVAAVTDAALTIGVSDELDPDAADDAEAGLLGLTAQFLFLNPPANAAVAQANGTAPTVPADARATDIAGRTRADQRLLESTGGPRVNGAAQQPQANVTNEVNDSPLANPAAPAPTRTLAQEQLELPAPTIAEDADGPAEIAARFAHRVASRAGIPNIPPQAAVVPDLPGVLVPADLSAAEPVVNEPAPIVAASALPATDLGDRPANAGEKFAAIASAGSRLATSANHPPSRMFANTLERTATEPAPAAGISPAATIVTVTVPALTPPTVPAPAVATPATALPVPPAGEVPPATAPAVPTIANPVPGAVPVTPAAPSAVAAPVATVDVSAARPDAAPAPTFDFAFQNRADDAPALNASGISNVLANAPAFGTAPAPVAPNAPAAPVPVANLAGGVADTIVTHARVMERPGEVEFQMRVDPPELGKLHIRLVANGDELRGHVVVADDAVRRMLESQLPELRQRLEAAGVSVQQFNVATDSGTGGGRNPHRDAAPEFDYFPRIAVDAPAAPPRARIGRNGAGSLDVTV